MDHQKRIDKSVSFVAVNIAVLTVSDSRRLADDKSVDLFAARVTEDGHHLADRSIVTDDFNAINSVVSAWVQTDSIDVVIATGGTGLTGRDGTPEAFRSIFEKEIEGFGELFRYVSFQKIGTSTIQSRAVGGCWWHLLFALPDPHLPAVMLGMKFCAISSIFVTVPVILLKLCRVFASLQPCVAANNARFIV